MSGERAGLEGLITRTLGASREPLREIVLYQRVARVHAGLTPERFLAELERLATMGRLRVAVEHEQRTRDAPPFQPRFWRVVDENRGGVRSIHPSAGPDAA